MAYVSSYKTQSYDTAIATEVALFDLWRSWTPTKRATHLNHNTYNARSTAWHIAKTTLARKNKTQQIRYFLKNLVFKLKLVTLTKVGTKNCLVSQGSTLNC